MRKLWNDECGAVMAAELILILTVVGLGVMIGMKVVQVALVSELHDVADAIASIDQSWSSGGQGFQDPGNPVQGAHINYGVAPAGEGASGS